MNAEFKNVYLVVKFCYFFFSSVNITKEGTCPLKSMFSMDVMQIICLQPDFSKCLCFTTRLQLSLDGVALYLAIWQFCVVYTDTVTGKRWRCHYLQYMHLSTDSAGL